MTQAAVGSGVEVRMRIFTAAGEELRALLLPPWPGWVSELYQLERSTNARLQPESARVTASAAVSALAEALKHRIDLLSFVCAGLEAQGFTLRVEGDSIVGRAALDVAGARERLESGGILGPMCKLAELDDQGSPLLATPDGAGAARP